MGAATKPTSVLTSDGRQISLGNLLGQGGEGAVFEVLGKTDLVAKLYLDKIDAARAEKLNAMVGKHCADLEQLGAWPNGLLFDHTGRRLLGFTMRKIVGYKPIHTLYTPKSRLQQFPKATWPFLIHSAFNIATAFAVIHSHNVVVGDVNHGNVLINDSALSALIDCDSFQMQTTSQIFTCEVGVPEFTPPELQDKDFSQVKRTVNHDDFGLAVLIFHLLFMGRHPFAGRYSGSGDMTIELAIKESRFAFSSNAAAYRMVPPPNSLQLSDLPPTIATLFEQAFSKASSNGLARPGPTAWIKELETLKKELTTCSRTSAHQYYKKASDCPWCRIEMNAATVLFLNIGIMSSGGTIDSVWSQILSIPDPGSPPALKTLADIKNFLPSMEARVAGRKRRLRLLYGVAIVLATVTGCALFNTDPTLTAWLTVIAMLVGTIVGKRPKDPVFASAVNSSHSRYQELQRRWSVEAGNSKFIEKKRELEHIKNEILNLPRVRQQKLADLQKNLYQVQLNAFLDRHYIRDAVIRSIGPTRVITLSNHGIDTAADINPGALQQVPGIGPRYSANLIAWRDTVAANFKFNPQAGVDRLIVAKIDREIADHRSASEKKLVNGATELRVLSKKISIARVVLQREAESVLAEHKQAWANLQAS